MTATTTEARYSVFKLDRFYRVWDARENTFVRNPLFEFPTTDFDFRSDAARVCDELNATDTATQPEPTAETPAESDDDSDDDQPTRPAARKPMDHLPKQPRRRSDKPGRFNSPARRLYNLRLIAERVNNPAGILTVAARLAERGASADLIRRYASPVGRAMAKAYRAAAKAEPTQTGLAVSGRRLVWAAGYRADDLALLDGVIDGYEMPDPNAPRSRKAPRVRLLDAIATPAPIGA